MRILLPWLVMLALAAGLYAAAPVGTTDRNAKPNPKTQGYETLEFKVLRAMPEEYKNKKVAYEGVYFGFAITFLPYMEKSGFEASKYFGIGVGDLSLPVMAKKNDDFNELIGKVLEKGATVKVYGKVKKYRVEPEITTFPHYYLELDYVEIVKDAPKPGLRPGGPVGGAGGGVGHGGGK